jgi:transglutaminase-like putative cysteine protease
MRSIQILRLIPRSDFRQKILEWNLTIPGSSTEHIDAYGNITRLLTIERHHDEICIGVQGVIDTEDQPVIPPAEDIRFDPKIFLRETPLTALEPNVFQFAEPFKNRILRDPLPGLQDLMRAIRSAVEYVKGSTSVQTTASEALEQGSGVCQDHSHLFISCCRALKIPARYVSGYLYQGSAATPEVAMHAWTEAWIDKTGWVSFDISNGRHAGETHIRLATGRDYLDASPVRGIRLGGGNEMMKVSVEITHDQ